MMRRKGLGMSLVTRFQTNIEMAARKRYRRSDQGGEGRCAHVMATMAGSLTMDHMIQKMKNPLRDVWER